MNIIDIAVIALAVIAIIWGAWKGFIAQLVSILGVFIGIWGASKLTPYVTSIVSGWFPEDNSEAIVKAVVFVLLVIIIILICHLIGKGLEKVAGITVLGGVNRFFGAVFCLLKAALFLVALASLTENALQAMQVAPPEYLTQSKTYALLNQVADQILPFVKEIFAKIAG
ncbi:MAG: CvpA family protein [Bacteroidales bacterium]|jgi:membrane protein required for colicin V production|nr:CvpA family protein [Bacteroidales bacterium]